MSINVAGALAAAAQRLGVPGLRAAVGAPLAGSPRAVVVRACPTAGDEHVRVVVKVFDDEQNDEGLPRESAALSVLNGRMLPAGTLLTAVTDPPLIVTADLGTWPSLADRLRGDDRVAAMATLRAWAASLGRLHAGTVAVGSAFAAGLSTGIAVDTTMAMVTDGIRELRRILPRVGVALSDEAVAALRTLAGSTGGPVALSPADTCPDNNVGTLDGLVLSTSKPPRYVRWPGTWPTWSYRGRRAGAPGGCRTGWRRTPWRSGAPPPDSRYPLWTSRGP